MDRGVDLTVARIGLLSDTHGRAEIARRAVRLLIDQGAGVLIHLGDVGGEKVIDALVEQVDGRGEMTPPVHVVFGNCDDDAMELGRYASGLGIVVDDFEGRMVFDGKRVAFMHGHQAAAMNHALADGVEYLCHGHTHHRSDKKVGATRVINPGALCRADRYTVAILDTERDKLEFFEVA